MNEQTNELIKQLSEKLGVGAERLWGALLKQAPINSTCELICMTIFAVMLFISWKRWKSWEPDHEEHKYVTLIPLSFVTVGLIVWVCQLGTILSGYFNPDYWALNHILSALK